VALVLAFWCVHQPLRIGMGSAFLLGLMMDVVDGSVMGQHALAYVPLAFAAAGLSRASSGSRLAQQALHALPMLLGAQIIMVVARLFGGAEFPGILYFLSSFVAAGLWYSAERSCCCCRSTSPVERDENRPI